MKKLVFICTLVLFGFSSLTSCSSHHSVSIFSGKKVPPGQMKKMTGDKSAKKYAPGQQKKRYKH